MPIIRYPKRIIGTIPGVTTDSNAVHYTPDSGSTSAQKEQARANIDVYSKSESDSRYIQSETDPTVPSWAKQQTKPAYTAAEVGALPDSTVIPSKTSQLQNDSSFITSESLTPYRTAAAQDTIDAGKQPTISDLPDIRSGAAAGATAVQPESGKGLFSGNYNDLTDKPAIAPFEITYEVTPLSDILAAASAKRRMTLTRTVDVFGTEMTFTADVIGTYVVEGEGVILTCAEIADLLPLTVYTINTDEWLHSEKWYLTSHQSLSAYRTAAAQDLIDAGKQAKMDVITYDVSSYEDVNDALSTGKPVMLAFDAYTAVPISSYDFDMQSQDIRIYIVTGEHVSIYSLTQSDVWDTQDVPLSVYLNPDAKTSAMTQAVGKDNDGKLWTTPGSSGAAWGSITGTLSSQTDLQTALNGKQAAISDLSTIRTGAGLGATAVQPEAGKGLFSGSYNDLTNKPTIPAAQVNADWNAASGVAQILNKPVIPAAPTVVSVSLPTASWIGSASPYTQTVSVTGATANSKIDLQPDSTVIAQMLTDGTSALYIENNNGTLTAYAIGTKPGANLTVQATRTEVTA